jgi:uroporphyrinogen decarboxylase
MMDARSSGRQRIMATLDHREGDRVPVIANLAAPVAAKVAARLGLSCDTEPFRALNTLISGRASFNELLVELGNDCIGVAAEIVESDTETSETGDYLDEWKLAFRKENGYLEVISRPLRDAESATEIRNFAIPDPSLPARWNTARKLIDIYGASQGVVGCMGQTMFETCWNLIGFEKFLMDFQTKEEYLLTLLDRLLDYSISYADCLADVGCDIIFVGDDVGMQDGMLISAPSWRELLKPRLSRLFRHIKAMKPKSPNL